MSKETVQKIISAVVGLSLVGFGGWLIMRDEGEHGSMLLLAGLAVIGGGLGTALLPSAMASKDQGGPGSSAVLALVLAAGAVASQGCSSTTAAAGIALKTRDVGCTGGRIVCRVLDRTCRGSGGPWVVPRSDAEVEADRAAGAFGEVTGGGEEPSQSDTPAEDRP